MWQPGTNSKGQFEPTVIWYTNTKEDVSKALWWLGQAAEYDAGRTSSAKAGACAGIVSSEVSTMLAKQMHAQEQAHRSKK